MECISTISYSLLINGSLEGKNQPSSGIREGDHLCPYIFIIYIEFFARKLIRQYENPKIYIRIQTHRGGPKNSFLMFVDYIYKSFT